MGARWHRPSGLRKARRDPLVAPDEHKAHELIPGLGSATLGTRQFGDRERVVGLTTAFSGDGSHWLTETSRTVKCDEHEDAVVESAVASSACAKRWRGVLAMKFSSCSTASRLQ